MLAYLCVIHMAEMLAPKVVCLGRSESRVRPRSKTRSILAHTQLLYRTDVGSAARKAAVPLMPRRMPEKTRHGSRLRSSPIEPAR
jgi:hypothetical protein